LRGGTCYLVDVCDPNLLYWIAKRIQDD